MASTDAPEPAAVPPCASAETQHLHAAPAKQTPSSRSGFGSGSTSGSGSTWSWAWAWTWTEQPGWSLLCFTAMTCICALLMLCWPRIHTSVPALHVIPIALCVSLFGAACGMSHDIRHLGLSSVLAPFLLAGVAAAILVVDCHALRDAHGLYPGESYWLEWLVLVVPSAFCSVVALLANVSLMMRARVVRPDYEYERICSV